MNEPSRRRFVRAVGTGAAAVVAGPVFAPERSFAGVPLARAEDADVHLNCNESAYGPSPRALAAVRDVTPGSTEVLKACDDVFLAGGAPLVAAEPACEAVIFLRVTLGTEREMGAFHAAFRDVMRA